MSAQHGISLQQVGAIRYPTGKKIPAKEFAAINVEPDRWHGDWNYVIKPRKRS